TVLTRREERGQRTFSALRGLVHVGFSQGRGTTPFTHRIVRPFRRLLVRTRNLRSGGERQCGARCTLIGGPRIERVALRTLGFSGRRTSSCFTTNRRTSWWVSEPRASCPAMARRLPSESTGPSRGGG